MYVCVRSVYVYICSVHGCVYIIYVYTVLISIYIMCIRYIHIFMYYVYVFYLPISFYFFRVICVRLDPKGLRPRFIIRTREGISVLVIWSFLCSLWDGPGIEVYFRYE